MAPPSSPLSPHSGEKDDATLDALYSYPRGPHVFSATVESRDRVRELRERVRIRNAYVIIIVGVSGATCPELGNNPARLSLERDDRTVGMECSLLLAPSLYSKLEICFFFEPVYLYSSLIFVPAFLSFFSPLPFTRAREKTIIFFRYYKE